MHGVASIHVTALGEGEFQVEVREGDGHTRHRVSAAEADRRRYGGDAPAERLLEESFRFLLEREPKESILGRFELPVIERYFPEYGDEIRRRLGAG